jgi:hypothetical protein
LFAAKTQPRLRELSGRREAVSVGISGAAESAALRRAEPQK